MKTRSRERVTRQFFEASIHEAKVKGNVVEGVVILGPNSANKGESGKPRVYTEAAMKAACEAGVYEGVQSYIDHADAESARPTRELLGVFKNTRFEGGKVKGDLVVSSREQWFIEDAKDPDLSKAMGFSHDAFVDINETDVAEEVTGIPEAISVDLVSRPATTKGVFESVRPSRQRIAKKATEAEVGDLVLCDDYGSQVVGTVMKKGDALLVQVGDGSSGRTKLIFDDEAIQVQIQAPADAGTEPGEAGEPEGASNMAGDAKSVGNEPAVDPKASATEARLRKLEQENTRLRLSAALAKYPEKAREAVAKRLDGKILTDEDIAAEVATLDAVAEAMRTAPGVDPDLAAPRTGEDKAVEAIEGAALLLSAFGSDSKRASELAKVV